jgi:hypothetical protein
VTARLALAIAAGVATGTALGLVLFGPGALLLLLPTTSALRRLTTFLDRLAQSRPLATDLLALACLAAIPAFGLWDLASAAARRRDLRRVREGIAFRPPTH